LTATIAVVIADDEAPARQRLRDLLRRHGGIGVAAECVSGPSAVEAIVAHAPPLVFLDVQMPGCSGIDVVRRLPADVRPVVVFTTAYDRYALDAFEQHAVDYLLKPFSDERFDRAMQHALAQLRGRSMLALETRMRALLADWPTEVPHESPAASRTSPACTPPRAPNPPRYLERLAVRERGRARIILVRQIEWLESARDHVVLHCGAERLTMRSTFHALLQRMDPGLFLRIHRSTAVQLSSIVEMQPLPGNEDLLVLRDGSRLTVSRSYREAVRLRLGFDLEADV
jgi:two-component system LytT family response regulator